MDKSDYKVCTECGLEKHVSEFSKSYPHRCKACVAEHTKMVRIRAKQEQKHPEMQTEAHRGHEKDFVTKKEIDWEARRYELVKESLKSILSDPECEITPDELANSCVSVADAIISKMKGGEKWLT